MKILLTFYLTICTLISFAQNEKIDSLQQALKNYDAKKLEQNKNLLPEESDTVRVNILNNLSRELMLVSDYVVAKKHADDALAIAQQIGFKRGIANSYNNIGNIYWSQGNYPEALKNHFTALNIREETGDRKGIAASYNNIGLIYFQKGNYPEALKYYFVSLKLKEEIGDKKGISSSHNNLGMVYNHQGNYPEALKNYFASLEIDVETGDKNGIATSYHNIGNIYYNQSKLPEALKYFFDALKIFEETGNKSGEANAYFNIANIYSEQGNHLEALKYCVVGLKLFEEIGDKNGIAISYYGIGVMKLKMQAAGEGKDWLMKSLALSKEIGAVDGMRNSYAHLASADSALGNFNGAYENHKLFVLYSDSLNNEEVTKKTMQSKMEYEFDKKEAETKVLTDAELNKQKLLRNGFVGGFAVVLLFAGVFFRQRNKIKKEKHRAETALDELKSAQQKLVEKGKLAAIGTLAQRMAHEIQNPLNFVNNFSDLAEELTVELANAKTEEERQEIISAMKENMSKINHHGKRADGIIKNLQRHLNEGKGLDLFQN